MGKLYGDQLSDFVKNDIRWCIICAKTSHCDTYLRTACTDQALCRSCRSPLRSLPKKLPTLSSSTSTQAPPHTHPHTHYTHPPTHKSKTHTFLTTTRTTTQPQFQNILPQLGHSSSHFLDTYIHIINTHANFLAQSWHTPTRTDQHAYKIPSLTFSQCKRLP